MSADIYSLSIIIFELFSGIDPFPGHIGQIFQAKMSNKHPDVPSDFPVALKELIFKGWSKEPKKRPPIEEFKSALNKMLTAEETKIADMDNSLSMQERQTERLTDKQRDGQTNTAANHIPKVNNCCF